MRIISGIWKGQQLEIPPAKITRPTSDRARQAIFNIIEHNYKSFEKTLIADLCAGSGAMGLESLSRGAQHATFVENHHTALRVLEKNITKLKAKKSSCILKNNVKNLPATQYAYDYIFFDPPYGLNLETPGIEQLITKGWITPQTILCLETESTNIPPNFIGLDKIDERCYGRAGFSFWQL